MFSSLGSCIFWGDILRGELIDIVLCLLDKTGEFFKGSGVLA